MRITTACGLILLSLGLFGQNNYFYWYKGAKIPLELKNNKKFVLFNSDYADSTLEVLKRKDWNILKSDKDHTVNTINPFLKGKHNGEYSWAIIEKKEEVNTDLFVSQLPDYILYVSPFFLSQKRDEAGLSHLFYVRLHKTEDINILEDFADKNNVEILGNNKFMPLWYTLTCTKRSAGNAMEMANLFYESGKFSSTEPDLIVDNLLQCVNDEYFTNQWNLNNTGQYDGTSGIDINYCETRDITSGSSDIVVAVLDQGIEMDHPDLPNMFNLSYDALTDTQPSQVWESHATAVAGIIGASSNNNDGIAGIAPSCLLMSISHNLVLSTNISQELANGINWAWHNGADILNNSWGHNDLPRNIIDEAIDSALTEGRNGLGCVVVFSSGNDNTNVSYPANCNPDIIAVGAISQCGERKSPNSCDGEAWHRPEYNDDLGGSNYGSELDLVAPGVLVPTTDRQGNEGYNPNVPIHTLNGGDKITTDFSNQDYTIWFNGTSAAAPHVAGVAALVLSVNPNLTQDQVRNIIESTAQKVGSYTYSTTSGRTNGTWNNEMGYGLVNAYGAVLAAAGGPISGPTLVCSLGGTFSISPLASFDNIQWNVGPMLSINSGQGTTSCSISATGSGSSYVSVTVTANGHNTTLPQKTVWVGAPPLFDISGPATIVLNSTKHYISSLIPSQASTYGINYYDWSITNRLQFTSSHAYQTDVYVKGIALGLGTIRFYTTNSCGTSTFNFPVRVVSSKSLNIYPNPASNEITIEITDDVKVDVTLDDIYENEKITNEDYMVTIYDNSGILVYSNWYSNISEIKLNISEWFEGIYYVTLIKGYEKYSGSFIINN